MLLLRVVLTIALLAVSYEHVTWRISFKFSSRRAYWDTLRGSVCTWSWLCDFRQLAHLVDERCHYRRKSNRKVHDLFRSRGQFAVVLLVVDPGRIKFDGAVGRPTSLHTKIAMESGLGLTKPGKRLKSSPAVATCHFHGRRQSAWPPAKEEIAPLSISSNFSPSLRN
jgi:hypothetical protein